MFVFSFENYRKSFISMVLLILLFHGQGFAQWERTNFPPTVKVNTLTISDSSIFTGTDGDGIFVSTDHGENWEVLMKGFKIKLYIPYL